MALADTIQILQRDYLAALRSGDEGSARAIVARGRAAGVAASEIYLHIFTPSMVTIGELWERNELSVAEEHLATAITDRLIGELSPSFGQAGTPEPPGTALIGCVAGERHALGPRMLADLFRRHGWRVLYLGADVPTEDWVTLAVRYGSNLVAISVGMRLHLPAARALIERLRAALPDVVVLVGGSAFAQNPNLWRELGADLYHTDTTIAVEQATARAGNKPTCNGGRAAVGIVEIRTICLSHSATQTHAREHCRRARLCSRPSIAPTRCWSSTAMVWCARPTPPGSPN
jgi:MerR family transcriptional regulator, light-induced transcriptional regulator